MQTFLPFNDFELSLDCLDDARLGKQRVEAMQIVNVLEQVERQDKLKTGTIAWRNHPATKMWEGYLPALKLYHNTAIYIWKQRGFKNTMELYPTHELLPSKAPNWLGWPAFHRSHRLNLLRKNVDHYRRYFPMTLERYPNYAATTEYIWPTKCDRELNQWLNRNK